MSFSIRPFRIFCRPANPALLLFVALLFAAVAVSAADAPKRKPTGLKRPSMDRSVPVKATVQRAPTKTFSPLLSAQSISTAQDISISAAGSNYVGTPPPSASFEALLSDGSAFNPDTHGAVGPNHLMVTLNTEVRVQTRTGVEVSRVSLDGWWSEVGASNVFDPRIVYDPYGGRFIFSANNDPGGPNPGLLIAVSATSDPTGVWHRRFIDIDTARPVFADSPMVGFSRHWIVLSADTYTNSTSEFANEFAGAEIYVYNKTNFYAGGSSLPALFSNPDVGTIVPVVTYDTSLATNYLVAVYNPDADGTNGYLSTYAIGGTPSAPVLYDLETYPGGAPWADFADQANLAPQLDSTDRIALGDSRITSATWRRGTFQVAHTVFLPAVNPTRAAVQWWEFTEDTIIHLGRIDSGHERTMYAFPSIAANRNSDIVLGFSRFSTNAYPSAMYAYREDFDSEDSLRSLVFLKEGGAPYYRTNGLGENLWGDWSATMVDPLNDTDFWTIQQYAESPTTTSRWGTWWGRVSPPNDLVLTVNGSPNPVVAGSNLTYSITITNVLADGRRAASAVRISNALPASLTFVSASVSQGSCTHADGVVLCDVGVLTNATRITASIVVRPTVVGTVENIIAVHANGPDADPNDNSSTVTTTVNPSADLGIFSIVAAPDPVTATSNLTYTVTVTNRGPAEAVQVRLTNNLPASCTFLSVITTRGSCTNAGNLVHCNLGNVFANTAETITIVARPNTGGITISNRVLVAASSIDTVASNNIASTLTYVNARPTISGITSRSINEDTTTGAIAFTIGDAENPSGTTLLVERASSDTNVVPLGNVVLGGTGTTRNVTVTPAPNASGSSVITLFVTDAHGITASTSFTVTVIALNDVPTITAISDPDPINEDTSTPVLSFTVGDVETPAGSLNVTGGSSNPALIPIANIVFTGAGTANRTVRVTPATNQVGTATITVTVSDGVASVNETFSVTVTAVNDPPAISTIADRAINEDTPTPAIPFTMIDVETPGTLTLSASSSNPALVPDARVVFGGTGTNRTATITPATNQFGTAQITITVSDGTLTDTSSFTLTVNPVNDLPTLNTISNLTTNEDAGVIIVPLTGISSGAANEDQLLQITSANSNPAVIESAVVTYTSDQPTGSLRLETATNAVGTSTITLTLTEVGASSNNVVTRSFTVTLTAVNDPPVISAIGNQVIDEDTSTAAIPFTISDVETAGALLTLSATSSSPTVVPVGNITFGGSGNARTVAVRPATNQSGPVLITLTVSDGATNDTSSFVVDIRPINDPPRFVVPAGDRSGPEDAPSTIPFTVGDVETPAGSLTLIAATSDETLVPLSNISFGGSGSNRTVVVMPAPNRIGPATITLTLRDQLGEQAFDSFVLTITNVNDAPRILGTLPNQVIDEDTATATIPFSVDDEETAAGSLTVTASSSNPTLVPVANVVFGGAGTANRTVRVTPAANQFGVALITVMVNDGVVTGSNSFQVTVNSINDLPTISAIPNVVTNEDFPTIALPFTVRDVETTAASLTLLKSSSNPEVVDDAGIVFGGSGTNRTVIVRPLTNQVGFTTITISVMDGNGATVSTEFEVTFNDVDDPPSIMNIGNLTVSEDTNSVFIAFTVDDPETLPQNLTVTATSSNPSLVPQAALTLGGTAANRTLLMVPNVNQSGTTTISISVSDGTLTTTDTFVLTVAAVNDVPTISNLPDFLISEDSAAGPLPLTVGDVDSATLTLTASSSNPILVPVGSIVFGGSASNRTVTVTPAANGNGAAVITVFVSDGAGTNSTDFNITVAPVNDPPTLNPIASLTIAEDAALQTVAFNGVSSGAANEAQFLTVTATSDNPALVPQPNVTYTSPQTNGTLRFTPTPNSTGTARITVTVDDGQPQNRSISRTFTVTVNSANDAPTISDIANVTTSEDFPVTTQVTIGDLDTNIAALTLTGTSSNPALLANTNILFNGAGAVRTITLIPTLNQFGTSTVTVAVSDGVATASDTFVFTVIGANDPPTLSPIPDAYVSAGASTVTLTLRGISTGAANETQTLVLSNSFTNPALFQSSPTITYTSPNGTASLAFRPANNATGTSIVTVIVRETNTNVNHTTSQSFAIIAKASGNANPTISTITNRTTLEDTPIVVPVIVNDSQTPAALLTVSAFSTNQTLFPSSSFAVAVNGTNRTLTITPAANLFGSAGITVFVNDTNFGGVSTNFVLTVTSVNDVPTISDIGDQTISEDGSTSAIPFVIGDVESPAPNLTLSATSSNPTLIPNANIVFGGAGSNRVVTVTPLVNQSGSANIDVVVTDGSARKTNSFAVIVTPSNDSPTISTIADVIINEDTTSGAVAFTIGDLETPAANLSVVASSSNPSLIQNVALGGAGTSRSLTIVPNPDQFGSAIVIVTVTDSDGAPASTSFDVVVTPVNDPPQLNPIANVPGLGTGLRTVPLSGIASGANNEAQTLFVAASSSNLGMVPHPTVNYTSPSSSGTLSFIPVRGATGSATITVTVSDGQAQNHSIVRTFTVSMNNAPDISDIADQVTDEDVPLAGIPFTVTEPDTGADSLAYTIASSNPTLVPISSIVISGAGANRTLAISPASERSGTAVITITVTDPVGSAASDTFTLTCNPVNDAPTLNTIGDRTVLQNSAAQTVNLAGITAGPLENQALTVTASSDNPAVVPHPAVNYASPSGTGTLTFRPATNVTGTATITVTVTDSGGTAFGGQDTISRVFTVTVNPLEPPRMTISRSGNQVTVAWPVNAGSFALESRDSLSGAWGGVSETAQPSGSNWIVTQTIGSTNRFYRLRPQ